MKVLIALLVLATIYAIRRAIKSERRQRICPRCGGRGNLMVTARLVAKCGRCRGDGWI